jgi:hypothetical protein
MAGTYYTQELSGQPTGVVSAGLGYGDSLETRLNDLYGTGITTPSLETFVPKKWGELDETAVTSDTQKYSAAGIRGLLRATENNLLKARNAGSPYLQKYGAEGALRGLSTGLGDLIAKNRIIADAARRRTLAEENQTSLAGTQSTNQSKIAGLNAEIAMANLLRNSYSSGTGSSSSVGGNSPNTKMPISGYTNVNWVPSSSYDKVWGSKTQTPSEIEYDKWVGSLKGSG